MKIDKIKEKYLKEKGFKKKWNGDKSGFWMIKKFKLQEFDFYFYYDGNFCLIEIEVLTSIGSKYPTKTFEAIWEGNWNQFISKINKYGI